MKEHKKRWLVSNMKTSGSKRAYIVNGTYSEDRAIQKRMQPEDLPSHESIKTTCSYDSGKLNYGLLIRFLRGQVGNDWDTVYSEIVERIPTKLLDYKEMILRFVADKVELIDGRPWNKKTQRFLWTGEAIQTIGLLSIKAQPEFTEFYVHPDTKKLVRIEQRSYKRITRKNPKSII